MKFIKKILLTPPPLAGNGLWLGVVPKTNINYEN
jgi:hypothetical protein